eukprot:CAMPEP_0118658760 /NCGR_PEP_ID=MMETSP0785-20121206/14743_1 /TAXON_ID=91992 /ORGANISM="Bolidomonas pacifica, Strain CCMP 1866" /LENGTH=407 /DNA_ID=CAMNT_0006551805 /DNA_START=1 /DNA_END=1221 /DNA_ORIENTATION=-
MASAGRKRWVQAKEAVFLDELGNFPGPSTSNPSSSLTSPSKVGVMKTTDEQRGKKSTRCHPKGWSRSKASPRRKDLSPIEVVKPVTPPGTGNNRPSPRAGKNQKTIPTLKDGLVTPDSRRKEAFGFMNYGDRDLVNESLGISVSSSGELLAKRDVVNAWSIPLNPVLNGVGESDNDVVQIDRVAALRMTEEEKRVRERRDKEDDIYYQFWKREVAGRIEAEGEKVADCWVSRGGIVDNVSNGEQNRGMIKSNSTFLCTTFGEEDGEELKRTRAEEEVRRMRGRLLKGLDKDDMQIVSESDGEVEIYRMDQVDPAKNQRWRLDVPTDSEVDDTDAEGDGDTIKEASWRRRRDLSNLMEGLTSVPTPKSRGGVGAFLLKSMVMGMESGGREEGFVWERSSMEQDDAEDD